MELSIIVTNYKNPELLKVCIDSIRKNLTLKDYEIIVSDGETEEKTEMMMREDFPEIKFISHKENVGLARLLEAGYKSAKSEYILYLNGDIVIKENSIELLLNYIKKTSDVGMVGPQLLNFNETLQYSCFRFYSPLTIVYRRTFLGKFKFAQKHLDRFLMKDFDHSSIKEVDWLMGSAVMLSRKSLEKVGLMDLRYKLYFEDTDWCRRFWENGYRVVYFPDAKMYHYHGRGSAGKNIIKTLLSNHWTWWHIKSAIKYFWKFRGRELPKHN